MEKFTDILEQEMIDLDTLKEMSHEDLQSVGVNTLGQIHILENIGESTRIDIHKY